MCVYRHNTEFDLGEERSYKICLSYGLTNDSTRTMIPRTKSEEHCCN
jgi:hypothetical protein